MYANQDSYADVLPDMASGSMLSPKALFCLPDALLLGALSDIVNSPAFPNQSSAAACRYDLNVQPPAAFLK